MTYQLAFDIISIKYPDLQLHQQELLAQQHVLLSCLERLRQNFIELYGLEDLESFAPAAVYSR